MNDKTRKRFQSRKRIDWVGKRPQGMMHFFIVFDFLILIFSWTFFFLPTKIFCLEAFVLIRCCFYLFFFNYSKFSWLTLLSWASRYFFNWIELNIQIPAAYHHHFLYFFSVNRFFYFFFFGISTTTRGHYDIRFDIEYLYIFCVFSFPSFVPVSVTSFSAVGPSVLIPSHSFLF